MKGNHTTNAPSGAAISLALIQKIVGKMIKAQGATLSDCAKMEPENLRCLQVA
ncbi:hypothetical protein [Manganibacter manganicus]|uniref:hypothetical protein n=1 Tax=Manganibacter manganicus TaxID=1873176 RepID=UPI001301F229|nr:hypothetical protein [Pseudaminobacter manganicus]